MGCAPQVRKKPFFSEKRADSERGRIAGAAFAAEQFEGDYLLYPQKILEPSPRVSGQRDRESHASNCVCLMFRCCAFIAHRTPSQKNVARTRGRKSWQLTVAYNGFPALEPLRLPAAWQGISSCFFRHARCRRNIGNIGTPLHLWFRIITQSEIFLNHMYWNQRQKLCN